MSRRAATAPWASWVPTVGMKIRNRCADPRKGTYRTAIIEKILDGDVLQVSPFPANAKWNKATHLSPKTWHYDWSPVPSEPPSQLLLQPTPVPNISIATRVKRTLNFLLEATSEASIGREKYPAIFANVVCHCGHRFAEHSAPHGKALVCNHKKSSCDCLAFAAVPQMLAVVSDDDMWKLIDEYQRAEGNTDV